MDLKLIREQVRKLLREKLASVALSCDHAHEFPWEAYNALADSGLAAMNLPQAYGGADDLEGFCVVIEEMSKISPAFALSVMVNYQLFGHNIARLGNPPQKEKYLKAIVTERKIGCWALTEPDVGSDAIHIKTTAKKKGTDYVLKGSKTFISNSPIADYFIVIALTGREGFDAATAFILEKGMKGLTVSQPFKKHGHRASPTGQIFLDDVKVSEQNILGAVGQGFSDMKHSLDLERFLLGPMVMGMLKALLEKSVSYAASREQFGQPIITYQLIQEKIARMRMNLEIMQALVDKGISLIKAGKNFHTLANSLKLYAGRMCVDMASEAMQILGGNGYMHEYGVEMFMRDAKLFEIGGGTNEMMLKVLAKQAMKEYS